MAHEHMGSTQGTHWVIIIFKETKLEVGGEVEGWIWEELGGGVGMNMI